MQGRPVQLERKAYKAMLAPRDRRAYKVCRARKATLAQLVQPAHRVYRVSQGRPDRLVVLERLAQRVQLARLVQPAIQAQQDRRASKAFKVYRAWRVQLDRPVLQVQ